MLLQRSLRRTLRPGTAGMPTSQPSAARGRSLHIGLNVVDNSAYNAQVPPLRGCHNDARDMMALAQSQGFAHRQMLLDAEATAEAIVAAISDAAQDLRTGDFFFVTYSGHGSQMQDPTGEEPDQLDETLVCWNRQLIDDELYPLWGRFQPGVRILFLSDSCHSGSVARRLDGVLAYRAFASSFQETRDAGFVLKAPNGLPLATTRDVAGLSLLRQSLRDVMPSVIAQLHAMETTATVRSVDVDRYVDMVLAQVQGDSRAATVEEPPIPRTLPLEIAMADAKARRPDYCRAKASSRSTFTPPPQAFVLLISGGQDNQVCADGSRNGLFTQRLLEVWDQGRFNGVGYPELHRRIVSVMPPQQTPNLYWATPVDSRFENQRPFAI